MLLSAVNNYDTPFTSSGSKISRKIYVTYSKNNKLSRDSISDVTGENKEYDIDASASTFLVNFANPNLNACMTKEDFSALSPKVKRSWSKIPPDMKAIILRSRTGSYNYGANNNSSFFV